MPKDDDRPRPSWRDIDKTRDRAGGPKRDRDGPPSRTMREEERQQKQYRAALEALFEKGEIGKLADRLGAQNGPRLSAVEAMQAVNDPVPAPAPSESTPAQVVAPSGSTPGAAPAGEAKAAGKKKGEDKVTLRRKVMEATSRHEITKAVERYLERFPMPDDHEFLEQILEHEQEGRVMEAMERIGHLLDQRNPPRRSRALCSKLRYLSETTRNDELRERAGGLLRRLS